MVSKMHFPGIYVSSIIIFFGCVIERPSAFTIKLIHRYASDSPFYNANLTYQKIVEILNFNSRLRKQPSSLVTSLVKENGTLLDMQAIRPSLDFDFSSSSFLVKINLGTFSTPGSSLHKSYYLDFDTGSSITWLQCEDCKKFQNHCYRQFEPPFLNSKSSSYRPLPCNRHPLCFRNKCIGDSCSYHATYADDDESIGILSYENFVFPSSAGYEEIVPLVFGCGIDNRNSRDVHKYLKTAGIFGMSWGSHSFVSQTNSISQGRFSYCFPPTRQAARGVPVFLRFGSDIPLYYALHRTRLIRYHRGIPYYVNLLDLSINGERLNILPTYFQKDEFGIGGCIFDTGFSLTHVSQPAYRIIKQAIQRYIARYVTSLRIVGHMLGYDLCYRASKPFTEHGNLPSVTFHFEGNADLVVKPETAFYINSHNIHYQYICLSMVPSDDTRLTAIGSDLQANQLIVYDTHSQTMYFGSRDCTHNS